MSESGTEPFLARLPLLAGGTEMAITAKLTRLCLLTVTGYGRDQVQPRGEDYGSRNSMPRSAFTFLVAATSKSETGIFLARCSVNSQSVCPTIA